MELTIQRASPAHAFDWLRCGWRLMHRRADLFVGMSVLYLVLALLLTRIPFMGALLLVLVSPALAAGALLLARSVAHSGDVTAGTALPPPLPVDVRQPRELLRAYVWQPLQVLLQALADERRLFPTIMLCTVVLGLVIAVKGIEYVFVGGSLVSGLQSPEFTNWLRPQVIVGMVLAAILFVLLAMALIFAAPLTALGEINPMSAIGRSFLACVRNFSVMGLFFGGYLAAYILLISSFSVSTWLGYFVMFTLGPILLAAYIGGTYCCYREVFGSDQRLTGEPP